MAQLPICLELRHSSIWHWGRRVLYLSLLIAILFVPWDWTVRLGLDLLVLLSLIHLERSRFVPITLKLGLKGRIHVLDGHSKTDWQDAFLPAEVVSLGLIHPWLTIFTLRWCDAHQTKARLRLLWVLPDSASCTDFRRLRVWLRWESQRAAELAIRQSALVPRV